eukprot:GEMP01009279.1.p1 GENE.GEMP01009279.1~~GEMP01009279.1.p1  ORF type:complete len:748 (+),score=144.49 GEMP01009279.1:565-2808(+)
MRIRHLQSHLSEQNLINQGNVKQLSGLRLGVDAVFWLRSIQALKDPFADALGGIPPGIFGFVDKELDQFKKAGITPIFVFQGIARPPQQQMFLNRTDQHTTLAWTNLAKGLKSEAQKCFAVSTSRINSDFVYFIFHHLKNRGYECFQAPYFAGAQLAHFSNEGMLHAAFASPGLLLYGVAKVLIHIEFHKQTFSWLDLSHILGKWEIELHQFIDSCMMAGTEYCLTYPFLNFENFPNQAGRNPTGTRFNFDAAVSHIKQTPLINWLQSFPTPEMKADHFDGYCVCKVLIQHSPVLHVREHVVKPLVVTQQGPAVPSDYVEIVGDKLPNALYLLMCKGVISSKIPQALARSEWTDKTVPLVDTQEYRQLLVDLEEYREKSLGLVARHLHPNFQKKIITLKAYFEQPQAPQSQMNSIYQRTLTPKKFTTLRWKFSKEDVKKEMERQQTQVVDFRFCLNWHAHEFVTDGQIYQGLAKPGECILVNPDTHSLTALVHLMLLEHLELISEDGGMTVLGDVLKSTPSKFQEPLLLALEMMKFGVLSGEPFDSPQRSRAFPAQVNYPTGDAPAKTKAILLLCRVLSLVPMRLKNDMWNADVNFDLAAFQTLARALKRSLRQLTEACLTSVLIKDLSKVNLLPNGFMCASPDKEDPLKQPAILPTFMLSRSCMGIVAGHFLNYRGDPKQLESDIRETFPCCLQPLQDLKVGIEFWTELKRCVDVIAEPLGATDLQEEMNIGTAILTEKCKAYNVG